MNSINDLLNDPLKGTSKAQNILSYLFREVLLWRKVNLRFWRKRTELYFAKPHNADYQDRGNLNKALKSNVMQWISFRRGMDFIDSENCTLDVRLTFSDGVKSYLINIDPRESESVLTINSFPWEHCELFTEVRPAETLLAHLIRHMLSEAVPDGEDPRKWFESKITHYVNEPKNSLGFTEAEVATFYNTLRRDILDPRISWNKFRRGISLLNPLQEEYILKLEWTTDPKKKLMTPDSIHRIAIKDPYQTEQD